MNMLILLVLKSIVTVAFLFAGTAKLMRMKAVCEQFHDFRLPPEIMVFIGVLEIVGAVLLWFDVMTLWAFSGLACLMLGAIKSHSNAKHPPANYIPATIMFGLCAAGAILFNWLN